MAFHSVNSSSLVVVIFLLVLYLISANAKFGFELPVGSADRIVSVTQQEAGTSLNVYVTTQTGLKILREDLTIIQEKNTSLNKGEENVLTILRRSEIFTCKNDFNGTCQLRDSSFLNLLSENLIASDVVYPGAGPIAVGWIDDIPGEGTVITIALSSSDNSLGYHGDRPLPLISTRKFPTISSVTSTKGALPLLLDDSLVPSSYIQSNPCQSDYIHPFYGFTAGNYRFILKEHTDQLGQGGPRNLKHVKLVRLCKRDETYRSYMELPLYCETEDGILRKGFEKEDLISSVAHHSVGKLYVSVTKRVNTESVTYICQYDMESINNAFLDRRKSCLEGKTETTEISWYRRSYCPKSTPPQVKLLVTKCMQ